MYGLVNKAVEQVIRQKYSSTHGEESWEDFRVTLVPEQGFLNMNQYPDEITYQMVKEGAEALGISQAELLEAVGRYWLLHTAQTGFGPLLHAFGKTPREMLVRLDNLHTQLRLSYTSLAPPSFRCTNITDDGLLLHYYSKRVGLTPLVIGLIKGISDHFNVEIGVELVQSGPQPDGAGQYDVFKLRFPTLIGSSQSNLKPIREPR